MTTNSHAERARLLMQQNRPDLAEPELRKAIALDPDDGELHAQLAQSVLQLGRPDEALVQADQAVGLEPELYLAHWARTHSLLALGRARAAEVSARTVLELDSEKSSSFGLLASAMVMQARWREAADSAEQGLAIDPSCEHCIEPRAIALVQLGKTDAAQTLLGSALATTPDDAGTHELVGMTALKRGDPQSAVERFREALRLDPMSVRARVGLVVATRAHGRAFALLLHWLFLFSRRNLVVALLLVAVVMLAYEVAAAADSNTVLAVVAGALLAGSILLLVLAAIAGPLSFVLLLLDRGTRPTLSRPMVVKAIAVLGVLAVSATLTTAWLAGVPGLGWPSAFSPLLSIPVTMLLDAWGPRRRRLAFVTIGLVVVGAFSTWHWVRSATLIRDLPPERPVAQRNRAHWNQRPSPPRSPAQRAPEIRYHDELAMLSGFVYWWGIIWLVARPFDRGKSKAPRRAP